MWGLLASTRSARKLYTKGASSTSSVTGSHENLAGGRRREEGHIVSSPHRQDLVQVHLGAVELEDFGDGANCVLRGVDIFYSSEIVQGNRKNMTRSLLRPCPAAPAVLLLDDLAHERHGLGGGRGQTGSTELTQHSAAVGSGLADLGEGSLEHAG